MSDWILHGFGHVEGLTYWTRELKIMSSVGTLVLVEVHTHTHTHTHIIYALTLKLDT